MRFLLSSLARVTVLLSAVLPNAQAADETTQSKAGAYNSKTADALWAHIEKIQQGPTERPKSQDDAKRIMRKVVVDLRSALEAFVTRYPEDKRRWKAEVMLANLGVADAMSRGVTPNYAKMRKDLQIIVESRKAPKDTKSLARISLITLGLKEAEIDGSPETAAASIQAIDDFSNDNPHHEAVIPLKLEQAKLLAKYDPARAREILHELEKERQPPISQMASAILTQIDVLGKPLDMEFNSVSGEKVSTANFRGKFVLLDFWATWCGPCVREVPDLVATHTKLKGKGFEIIGISLDQNKKALTSFTNKHKMTWPQYFDGKGWENEISTKYGIRSIPAMWLLNKNGRVVDMNARAGLEQKIEKLLRE